MPKWMYQKVKGEIVSKLFQDDDVIPKDWKESPGEAEKKPKKK